MRLLRLSKHHGLGNDFLVLIDLEDRFHLLPTEVRRICDRHRGVGADGLIRLRPGQDGAGLRMELTNSDGSPAEMSGNGIRCAAQVATDEHLVEGSSFVIETGGGPRSVEVVPTSTSSIVNVRVSMGPARVAGQESIEGRMSRAVDVGNPHLVLLEADPACVELATVARHVRDGPHGNVNVELVGLGPDAGALTIRTWERGAGETLACGTGSVAAVAATRAWGLIGACARVWNPGGPLDVELEGSHAYLIGPAERVANVEVWLEADHRP